MHRIRLQPSGLSFQVADDTDLLLAAAESGIQVPAACRNGVCEICEARLVSGQALNTRNQKLITVGERLMMCRTLALTDLKLEIPAVMASGNHQPRQYLAKVVDVRSISHDVYRVELQLPKRREVAFHAGQYLSVNLPGAEPCYFSIASSPSAANIELHIQASPDWVSAQKVIDALTSGRDVTVELPHGKACLAAAPDKPVLMVAAGTGFAQMKSLCEFLQETRFQHPVKLYWGCASTRICTCGRWPSNGMTTGHRSASSRWSVTTRTTTGVAITISWWVPCWHPGQTGKMWKCMPVARQQWSTP